MGRTTWKKKYIYLPNLHGAHLAGAAHRGVWHGGAVATEGASCGRAQSRTSQLTASTCIIIFTIHRSTTHTCSFFYSATCLGSQPRQLHRVTSGLLQNMHITAPKAPQPNLVHLCNAVETLYALFSPLTITL